MGRMHCHGDYVIAWSGEEARGKCHSPLDKGVGAGLNGFVGWGMEEL